jgi:arginyl-tRNA synthetase
LRKAEEKNVTPKNVIITTDDERNLALKIAQLNAAVWRAHVEKEPSIISDYVYTLAQVFSTFYNSSPIMTAESEELMSSRLALAKLVRDILVKLLYLLGIESPEVMLKKA